jgi:Protein of unknown function (DUF2510)
VKPGRLACLPRAFQDRGAGRSRFDGDIRERIAKFDQPAGPAGDPTPRVAGWYDDPEAAGVRRYGNGKEWTDSRVTTEGIPYPLPGRRPRLSRRPNRVALATVLLVGGGVCLWFAENYKPTLAHELGLNGNSHVLSPGAYHTLVGVGIVCPVLGGIRLLTALLP